MCEDTARTAAIGSELGDRTPVLPADTAMPHGRHSSKYWQ